MKILRSCVALFIIGLGFAVACQANKAPDADVREPAVAGRFYPEDPMKLRLAVEKFLEDAVPVQVKEPIAIIVPHAGYIYSGQICADAFKQVRDKQYDVIVILGTNHTTPGFDKISVHPGGGFRTPLGIAPIDVELAAKILAADPDDCVSTRAVHHREHSVEVIVPFVQVVFPNAKIVPIIVGAPDVNMCKRFGEALAKTLKDRRALIVASSDLSHYPAAEDAVAVDKKTLDAITTLDPARLHAVAQSQMSLFIAKLETCACGEAPVMAAMAAARSLGATRGLVVSYANSGDVAVGDRSQVVGYGAVVLAKDRSETVRGTIDRSSPSTPSGFLNSSDKKVLLAFARDTISRIFLTDTVPLARSENANLKEKCGVFVTLKKKNELRGCIGRIVGDEPLIKLVGAMALQAAFNDPRFRPVQSDELRDIEIEISVLTPMKKVSSAQDIVVGRDGVVLQKGGHSAVFLPQVATEQGWTREEMLDNLAEKAGLSKGSWREGTQFSTFQAVVFSEKEFNRPK
ncbi:MAG TPA: AmmeMemoRadiSam system protein B [Syntrophales bacterium]|nr:AmmeMemoRadiSam system protein B [Syntrophales bacterium]